MTWECGEYRTYQRHTRRKEPIDPACRAAAAAYMAEYRKTHPEAYLSIKARGHALTDLAALYPGVYRRLYADALAAAREAFWAAKDGAA